MMPLNQILTLSQTLRVTAKAQTMQLPAQVMLVAPRAQLAYLDCQSIRLPHPITPLQAWRKVMARPLPGMKTAFRLPDALSAPLGGGRGGGVLGGGGGGPPGGA